MNPLINQPTSGVYPFRPLPLPIHQHTINLTYPESFFQFPIKLLIIMLFSSFCKLAMPFAMQKLYKSMGEERNYFFFLFFVFISILTLSYILERGAQKIMSQHKLQVRKVLSERVTRNLLLKIQNSPQKCQDRGLWTKISSNINLYVNNYYDSYVNLVFQSFKTLSIILYLLYKLGLISLIGLTLCGCTVWLTLILSKSIQKATFANVGIRDQKVKILTKYFQRIVDYQMSWLDSFIAERIKKLQGQYHTQLKRGKLFDCVCVGLWQFTTIGISSTVLCCYYYYYGVQDEFFEPATIVYFFQMLTFPLNAISWNLAGLRNAKKAILQLSDEDRKPSNISYFKQIDNKKEQIEEQVFQDGSQSDIALSNKGSTKFSNLNYIHLPFDKNSLQIETNKIYGVSIADATFMKKMAIYLSKKQHLKVGYADQNSWFMPSIIETLLITPRISKKGILKTKQAAQILCNLQAHQIPYTNPVATYSGGQKMRISLCRALLWGKIIFIDSDLKSLDKITRQKTLNYLNSFVKPSQQPYMKKGYTIFIKDSEFELKETVSSWLILQKGQLKLKNNQLHIKNKVQQNMVKIPENQANKRSKDDMFVKKRSQVQTENPGLVNKKSTQQKQINCDKQLIDNITKISQILYEQSNKILNSKKYLKQIKLNEKTHHPTFSKKQSFKEQQKAQIGLKTLSFYFKSSEHIIFILSILLMKIIGNYFTYFINVTKPTDAFQHTITILQLAAAHILSITFRSYFFASANLKQAKRICLDCNDLTIYNHITFYGQSQSNQNKDQQDEEKQNSMTQRLVCLTNSDENTICVQFPFTLNIFFNNLGTVIGALLMVLIEVPHMVIFIILLYRLILNIDKQYRSYNESLKQMQKDQQINYMKVANYIEQGCDYIKIFDRENNFYAEFQKQLERVLAINNRTLCLGLWVKINYRIIMISFMTIAICLYWLINKGYELFIPETDTGIPNVKMVGEEQIHNYAGLAVMIRQIMSLTDYIFFFSLSFADTRSHAVSIQRIRNYAENEKIAKQSKQRRQHSQIRLLKIKQSFSQYEKIRDGDGPAYPLIQFRKLQFHYPNKNQKVFNDLNMVIYPGDRVVLKGKSGAGKTTLFKLITGLYPETFFPTTTFYLLSFSSQHPLRLPSQANVSILDNIDPYKIINRVPFSVKKIIIEQAKPLFKKQKKKEKLTYQDQVLMNNIRAYLYGYNGVAIYDEPMKILNQTRSTYLVVTHHRQFPAKYRYKLEDGKLNQDKQPIKNNQTNKTVK